MRKYIGSRTNNVHMKRHQSHHNPIDHGILRKIYMKKFLVSDGFFFNNINVF